MRISAHAQDNFAFNWQSLASSLGTPSVAAKLGAGIGGLSYLASDDKSIGSLATRVGGGAAIGYAGGSLKNAYQTRKAAKNTTPTVVPKTNIDAIPVTVPNIPSTNTSTAITAPLNYQNPKALPNNNPAGTYNIFNPRTTGTGIEQISPISQLRRPNVPLQNYPQKGFRSGNLPSINSIYRKNQLHFVNFSPYYPKAPR